MKTKKVLCVDTGEIFESAKEASAVFGCTPVNIVNVCLGRQNTAKGKRFQYIESRMPEVVEVISHATETNPKGKRNNGNTEPVFCISDGSIYTSCTDAAEQNNVTQGTMSEVCRGLKNYAKGKRYCYIKDINKHVNEIGDAIVQSTIDKAKYAELIEMETKRNVIKVQISTLKANIDFLEGKLAESKANLRQAEENLMNL